MTIIILDTCVLADLADLKSDWFEWSAATLEQLDSENVFVINPVIYAGISVGYQAIEEVEALVNGLGLEIRHIAREALFLAGKAILQYRRNGGQKTNVLPDFFIGAQAAVEKYQLMTRDSARFSSYFPSVPLILPGS